MKVIFMGTPDFAVPVLKALNENFEVVGVVTQVDKPVGRGGKLAFSPVKVCALDLGLKVFQYERVSKEGESELKALNADIIVTTAYGQILRKNILELTPYGVFNVHGSLLPKYRGASPIQSAIIDGEKVTGITILKSGIGVDDGDILLSDKLEIEKDETAGELFDRLSELGAKCIVKALRLLDTGDFTLKKQDSSLSTHTKKIEKEDACIDFSKPAQSVINWVRGLNPSPIAWAVIDNNRYKVYKCVVSSMESSEEYGTVIEASSKRGLHIMCADKAVEIVELQAENGKRMLAKNYLNGKKITIGTKVNE